MIKSEIYIGEVFQLLESSFRGALKALHIG